MLMLRVVEAWAAPDAKPAERQAGRSSSAGAGSSSSAPTDANVPEAGSPPVVEARESSGDMPLCFICFEDLGRTGDGVDAAGGAVLRTLPCNCKGSVGSVHLACFRKARELRW